MMLSRKFWAAGLLLVCLLLLAGCGGAAEAESWTLVWVPTAGATQSNAPEVAYAACVRAQAPGETPVAPAKNIWLASGSNPRVGLALTQLDSAGQFFAVNVITIDLGANRWQLTDSGIVARPAQGQGTPASQEAGKAWTLPTGTYHSTAIEVPDTPPDGSAQLWVSDNGQEFVLARLYSTIEPPALYTSVTLSGQPGWLTTSGRFTIIGLNLTTGIYAGLGTLIFAGTTDVQQSQQLAAQAAADLNDILPA
jgi:hypothetical protein